MLSTDGNPIVHVRCSLPLVERLILVCTSSQMQSMIQLRKQFNLLTDPHGSFDVSAIRRFRTMLWANAGYEPDYNKLRSTPITRP
ncbi:hypothetical protein Cagg_3233 [Chloroflexus aggregans DSM 9485]|uniref:Uncharacterized protein n=1 Tax=Chloroflexus aggregans (strain MD-66 / DSM 9485) TaxID=326427 RepID=B8G837_CHLAD|nr:hypothetical protein Cagg_3233 [Chloroflexus aggregans DSM 9485]